MQIKLGAKLRLTPSVYGAKELVEVGPQPCRVVYIHPLRRYFVVEFSATITGSTWREVKYFNDRAAKPGKEEHHANNSNF